MIQFGQLEVTNISFESLCNFTKTMLEFVPVSSQGVYKADCLLGNYKDKQHPPRFRAEQFSCHKLAKCIKPPKCDYRELRPGSSAAVLYSL